MLRSQRVHDQTMQGCLRHGATGRPLLHPCCKECASTADNRRALRAALRRAALRAHSPLSRHGAAYGAGSPAFPRPRLAGLRLFARANQPRMADITSIPPWKAPVLHDLRIHEDFDPHLKQRDRFKMVKFIVADLAELRIHRLRVSDL